MEQQTNDKTVLTRRHGAEEAKRFDLLVAVQTHDAVVVLSVFLIAYVAGNLR